MGIKGYVITINTPYSKKSAKACIDSSQNVNIIHFRGVEPSSLPSVMLREGVMWTWKNDNQIHHNTGLRMVKYATANMKNRVGCFFSHYFLWKKCMDEGKPILILEHDARFLRPLPDIDWEGACMINDPSLCTPRGEWWANKIKEKGEGVHNKTVVFDDSRPDGLAGNSAYLLKPKAAEELVQKVSEIGAWPNDALMCRQFFPWLQELYPFVTTIGANNESTTSL